MSLISRAIPGLFGGVSQQFPAMRHPTQGEQQDNALSTVVDGLYKRPGTSHVGFTPLGWASGSALSGNAFIHVIDRGENNRYGVLLDGSTVKVVNMTTGLTESTSILNDSAYLSASDPKASFRCVTVSDTTFIVNTGYTVLPGPVDTYTPNPNKAYIYVRTAAPQQTYYMTVNGINTTYTSPTSVNVSQVVAGVVAALNTIAGTSAGQVADITGLIEVTTAAPMASCTVSDTFGNATMMVISNGVTKFSDLPPRYPLNTRVKIAGSGPNIDPYYVEWATTEWKECLTPGVVIGFEATSMPHKLTKSGAGGTWEFQKCSWVSRLVGDNNTNPQPSFVGRKIRDIFFHRNRLGFLAGDSLAMSRSGLYFNFYAQTATAVLDTDPIDLGGTAESIDTLDWAVPFNLELIVWATSKQQFSLASGDVLSPNTARLVPTTAFSSNSSARPQQLGNRIIYPNTTQGHTQLGLYRVSRDTVSNTMESITDHIPSYIPDNPKSIEVSEAFRTVAIVPSGISNELYVFKYEDDGEKLTQRAWQKFTFGCDNIIKAHWASSKLYLFCHYKGATTGASADSVALEVIDFDTTVLDGGSSVQLRLDRKSTPTVVSNSPAIGQTTVTLPYRMLGMSTVLQSANGYTREFPVVSTIVGTTTTTIVVTGTWTGGTVVVGNKFTMRYRFSEIYMRDKDGIPIISLRLKVLKMLLHYIQTGFFKVVVTTKALGSYTYQFNGEGVGFGLGLGTSPTLVDGDFSIPVQAQGLGTAITIESDSFLPCRFPYAEWRASLNMKAQR